MTRGRRQRPFQRDRLLVVMGLFAAGFLLILGRLYGLQVGGHAKWYERGMRQYNQHATLQPERGEILDRHGRVLATSVAVPSVYAVPREIEQPEQTADTLTALLKTPDETLRRRLASEASFVWLARQVSPGTATQLRERRLPGVDFVTEMRRYYPKHHLAGQLLGFVGLDGQGLGGVEYVYDRMLRGVPSINSFYPLSPTLSHSIPNYKWAPRLCQVKSPCNNARFFLVSQRKRDVSKGRKAEPLRRQGDQNRISGVNMADICRK